MFDSVLIALDLAPAERPILDCIPNLKNWGVRSLTLTHIIRVGYTVGASAMAHEQDYQNWLEQAAAPLRAAGFEVDVVVCSSGDVVEQLLMLAEKHRVDCVVIGSRGHNMISRLFLGSTARELLQKARLPVLLEWVEPTAQSTREHCEAVCTDCLRHVLLATDFSREVAHAEQAVISLAANARRIDSIHVFPAKASDEDLTLPVSAQSGLAGLKQQFESAGAQSEVVFAEGKASAKIIRYAQTHNVSLIVVGKHGQNFLTSQLIGSTAANLSEGAGRPVLMIP